VEGGPEAAPAGAGQCVRAFRVRWQLRLLAPADGSGGGGASQPSWPRRAEEHFYSTTDPMLRQLVVGAVAGAGGAALAGVTHSQGEPPGGAAPGCPSGVVKVASYAFTVPSESTATALAGALGSGALAEALHRADPSGACAAWGAVQGVAGGWLCGH